MEQDVPARDELARAECQQTRGKVVYMVRQDRPHLVCRMIVWGNSSLWGALKTPGTDIASERGWLKKLGWLIRHANLRWLALGTNCQNR